MLPTFVSLSIRDILWIGTIQPWDSRYSINCSTLLFGLDNVPNKDSLHEMWVSDKET